MGKDPSQAACVRPGVDEVPFPPRQLDDEGLGRGVERPQLQLLANPSEGRYLNWPARYFEVRAPLGQEAVACCQYDLERDEGLLGQLERAEPASWAPGATQGPMRSARRGARAGRLQPRPGRRPAPGGGPGNSQGSQGSDGSEASGPPSSEPCGRPTGLGELSRVSARAQPSATTWYSPKASWRRTRPPEHAKLRNG